LQTRFRNRGSFQQPELSEKSGTEKATEQFQIHDTRSPAQIAEMLRTQNIDPVWKDFDQVLVQA
jgi:2-iminoacetate synthase ThiH